MDKSEKVQQPFSALMSEASSIFTKKKDEKKDPQLLQIQLEVPIKTLKLKGFREALGEAIRYLFYVSLAVAKGEVKRADDNFDSASRLFEVISPVLAATIPVENKGFKADLALGMVNLLFEIIRAIKDANARLTAERIVKAFRGGYGRIDVAQLKEITKCIAYRFQDQIARMTISLSTDGKLRLHENDGVVQFANIVAKRIGSHIMKGCNENVDQSNIAFLQGLSNVGRTIQINFQQTFTEAQNIEAKLPLATLERCLLATWQEIDGYDAQVECDTKYLGRHEALLAGDILTHTGIRDISKPQLVCERKGHFKLEVGYIYASVEEAQKRGYSEFHTLQSSSAGELPVTSKAPL